MRGRGGGNRGARAPAPYQRPVTMARGGFAPRGGRGGFPFAPARAQAFETPRDGGFFMHDDRETETAAAPVAALPARLRMPSALNHDTRWWRLRTRRTCDPVRMLTGALCTVAGGRAVDGRDQDAGVEPWT